VNMNRILGFFVMLTLLPTGAAWAQVTAGTISGTVKDSSGSVIPGAKVEILDNETGISRSIQTDSGGRYSAPDLSLGGYRVTASHQGFQTEVRNGIVLTVGREAIVDMTLSVGSVTSQVVVTGEAPLVDATSASLGSLVDDRTMRSLPLNGRSYDQLALLQPGVTRSVPGVFSNTSYTYGSGERFSVGGGRTYYNSFLMDGTNVNDQGNGTPGGANGLNLGMDTMEEYKIFTDAFKAEYGYASGSVTSIATRSGTNSFHGTAFEYIRNDVFDARNFFDVTPALPFKRNQFGGVLGGPIERDKMFFFAGYEGLRQAQEVTQTATVPDALARQGTLPYGTYPVNPVMVPFINLFPLPNGRDYGDGTAQYISATDQISNGDNLMVRIDRQLNTKTNIFARYILDQDIFDVPLSIPDEFTDASSRRQYATAQATSSLSPTFFNSGRFAFNRTRSYYQELFLPATSPFNSLSFVPGQPMGALNVGGGTQGGITRQVQVLGFASGNGNIDWNYNIIEVADDVLHIFGKHTFKFGGDFQRMQDNFTQPSQLRGTYTFTQFTTFLAGTPSVFQANAPFGQVPEWDLRQSLLGFYAQDDFRLNPRVMLNFGFRWQMTTDPTDTRGQGAILPSLAAATTETSSTFISIGKKNFEPRFGLAWQLDESGKTVLRFGGGIYHNLVYPWLYSQDIEVPPFYRTLSENNPSFPNGYTTLSSGLVALKISNPIQKTPTAYEYDLSFQREMFSHTVLQLAYAGNVGNHNQLSYEADTAVPTFCFTSSANCPAGLANGSVYYPAGSPRINPAWAGERIYETTANSSYSGGSVTFRRQFSNGLEGQVFYTYSKALDLESGTATSDTQRSPNAVLDPWDFGLDWGPSDYNSKNDVGYSATYPLPFKVEARSAGVILNGWTVDAIGTFDSGLPFTARLSTAVSRDMSSVLTERPSQNPGFSNNPIHGTTGSGCTGIAGGVKLGGPIMYYNPCAFSNPTAGTYGNVGRNTIVGPRLDDADFALEKIFHPTEKIGVTFRAEVFNSLNHPNFGLPNSSAINAQGTPNSSAGVITYTLTSSRQLQFGLRASF
jgi:hypothetical protein